MHQLSAHRHRRSLFRNETHRIDRDLRLLRNEPWQGHTNDPAVKPVQDPVDRPMLLTSSLAKIRG